MPAQPKPEAPRTLDGHRLPDDLRDRLQALIDILYADEPTRDPDSILRQAISAFRQTAKVARGRWILLRVATLDGGAGPAIVVD